METKSKPQTNHTPRKPIKTSRFERHQNAFFTIAFTVISLICFIGFLTGHLWHLYTTVLTAVLALFFYTEYKSKN